MPSFLTELKNRKVFRVAAAYAIAAFAVIEVADVVFPRIPLPDWTVSLVVWVAILGFPIALALAWAYDITPDGVRRAEDPLADPADPGATTSADGHGSTWGTPALRLAGMVVLAAAAAGLAFVWTRGGGDQGDAELEASRVAVAPFRVAGPPGTVDYLREGMVDLAAAKLTGHGGPRAVDPRAVLAAWRRAGLEDRDELEDAPALEVARALGAGLLMRGSVVAAPSTLTLTASLLRVPGGQTLARGTVEGEPDSLPELVDRLIAGVLARVEESDPARIDQLAGTPLPALRAYLRGQSELRGGRFRAALDAFREALRIDSTFALAALSAVVAAEWDAPSQPAAVARAQRLRDRLSPEDQVVLDGYSGAGGVASGDLIRAAEAALAVAPDRAELWYHLGESLHHNAGMAPLDSAREAAAEAFRRVVELDSAFLPAYPHLIEHSVFAGDTVAVRALSSRYFAADRSAPETHYLEWLVAFGTGDRPTLDSIRGSFDRMQPDALGRILGMALQRGFAQEDADRAASALRATPGTDRRPEAFRTLQMYDLARGRLEAYRRALDRMTDLQNGEYRLGYILSGPHIVVLDALFAEGDTAAARLVVPRLEERVAAPPPDPDDGQAVGETVAALWALQLWRLMHSDTTGLAETTARLDNTQLSRLAPDMAGPGIDLLETMAAAVTDRSDLPARMDRLKAVLDRGPGMTPFFLDRGVVLLATARLLEEQGDTEAAQRMLERRYALFFPVEHLPTFLRERARLASLNGDRESAVEALRHYLTLRTDPDPALVPEVEAARAELARLVGEGG